MYSQYLKYLKGDIQRFNNNIEAICSVSFIITFWFRLTSWAYSKNKYLSIPLKLIYKFFQLISGIQLPIGTRIGYGLRFFHYNCIVIAQQTIIGNNVSIHQGVTIGRTFNGPKAGVPTIGNSVVIFAGAKILGNVRIGNNAVIGANAVVVSDVPDNSVCVGVPGRIISNDSNRCFDSQWSRVFAQI